VGSWFELPKLGREAFLGVMKTGVTYEKGMGFKLDDHTDIEAAVRVLKEALAEEVELSLRCFVCGVEACPLCPYLEDCDRRRVSPLCLCEKHAMDESGYQEYMRTFRDNLNA
jgi:hypothetical protein